MDYVFILLTVALKFEENKMEIFLVSSVIALIIFTFVIYKKFIKPNPLGISSELPPEEDVPPRYKFTFKGKCVVDCEYEITILENSKDEAAKAIIAGDWDNCYDDDESDIHHWSLDLTNEPEVEEVKCG